MFWERCPAWCEHGVAGAAAAARGVHAPSPLEAPQAHGALGCQGSLHLPSAAVEAVGLAADNHHEQDQGNGGWSAR